MENIIDAAKDKINSLSEGMQQLWEQDVIAALKSYSVDKINEVWKLIEQSTETIGQTGYAITEISLQLGIPPIITLHLNQVENIADEVEEKLLTENKEKPFLYAILIALFKANAIQHSIQSVQYKFTGISIALGISPTIDMKFSKIE